MADKEVLTSTDKVRMTCYGCRHHLRAHNLTWYSTERHSAGHEEVQHARMSLTEVRTDTVLTSLSFTSMKVIIFLKRHQHLRLYDGVVCAPVILAPAKEKHI